MTTQLDYEYERVNLINFETILYDDDGVAYDTILTEEGKNRFIREEADAIFRNNCRACKIINAYNSVEKYDILTKQLTNKFQQITNERNDWNSIIFEMAKFRTKQDIIDELSEEKNYHMVNNIYRILSMSRFRRAISKTEEELYEAVNLIML
jgi:hypothetical protein